MWADVIGMRTDWCADPSRVHTLVWGWTPCIKKKHKYIYETAEVSFGF